MKKYSKQPIIKFVQRSLNDLHWFWVKRTSKVWKANYDMFVNGTGGLYEAMRKGAKNDKYSC